MVIYPLFGDRETEAGYIESLLNRTCLGSEDPCVCGHYTRHTLEVRLRQCRMMQS